jgi:hypothetical protein
MIAEGDKVMTRLSAYGTHTGELLGISPTGKQFSATAISIHRIANGKIVEHWSEVDNLGVLQLLGVVPPAEVPHQSRLEPILPRTKEENRSRIHQRA